MDVGGTAVNDANGSSINSRDDAIGRDDETTYQLGIEQAAICRLNSSK